MSTAALEDATWSDDALDEALVTLARAAGLSPRAAFDATSTPGGASGSPANRARWMEAMAHHVGVEAEPVECTYGELSGVLASLGPALVRVPTSSGSRTLAVLSSRRDALVVIDPSLAHRRISPSALFRALTASMEDGPSQRVDAWLAVAGVSTRRAAKARHELLKHFLEERRVGEMWLLRADPGSSFWGELRRVGVLRRAAWFALMSVAQVVASISGWALLGRSALSGALDRGWLVTWMLITLTAVSLQLASMHLGGRLAIDVAAVLKQRLLTGALRLDPDTIRTQGSGRLLGTVSESTAIETAGLAGAFGAAVALLQLASATVVLALGAGGALHVLLLAVWCGLMGGLVVRSHRQRTAWTSERLELTSSFVENVVGNRTRIAQQPEGQWHRIEDDRVTRYLSSSRMMDATSTHLAALPARGWLVVGLVGLLPAILSHAEPAQLAVSIGGILQAQAAFAALVASATALLGAHVAWRSVGHLFHAAAALPAAGLPAAAIERPASGPRPRPHDAVNDVVLDARGVSYRYRPTGDPVLRDCALTVREGDRVLLEGRSGGGKSTIAALLVGHRAPESGHILLRGLDAATLGARGWRQRVASAPQFHENHVLSGTLAFNLLMGRSWPAPEGDRREAEAVCRQLGLGRLLDRMPSGLDQVVGETGWPLSHGERSRIFLARALLQGADLVILDETFGALDPVTLRSCVDTVLARAPSLVVIAHP
ncbi:MAG: hypothetical protein BGO98_27550 [Myxococcales bacterium 68-20]|nr:MAG: hypothetical protein BGO98_27550 [Myxococcales bacterium 68-20]